MTVAGRVMEGEVLHVNHTDTTVATSASSAGSRCGRRGPESRAEWLLRRPREAWTHRDIYIQSDRLPGIVRPRALMSDPLFPVQKGERHSDDNRPKTGQRGNV